MYYITAATSSNPHSYIAPQYIVTQSGDQVVQVQAAYQVQGGYQVQYTGAVGGYPPPSGPSYVDAPPPYEPERKQ